MGWINYRQGKLADAERYLRQALQRYPDHEVAAHLGEVLWAQGRQGDARAIWREYLDKQPDSDVLRRTIKRLTGAETPRNHASTSFPRRLRAGLLSGCAALTSHEATGRPGDARTENPQAAAQRAGCLADRRQGRHPRPRDSGSGTLFWLQRQGYYDIRLSGPLGRGASTPDRA